MKTKKHILLIPILWGALCLLLWFGPRETMSDAERRPLAQMPEVSADAMLKGKFMGDFEAFTLDQFPLRDSFRTLKALFHQKILGQRDNNGIYIADGYAAKMEYPLNMASVNHAIGRLSHLYENYLTDSKVFLAMVPDKGYYLSEESGHLTMDYDALFAAFREGLPFAKPIDLTDSLSIGDYYCTDTHWRQENLIPAASKLCQALGIPVPEAGDYTTMTLEPFYGVYYGQAALPMEPDSLNWLTNEVLENCTVYDHETGKTTKIYDQSKADSKDLYDIFLSGAKPLLTIENPAAENDRELIVFRDSFGSSMVPLLVQGYQTVTVVDIRYIAIDHLPQFLDFHGQDVLLLYSTLVLNNSTTIR